MTLHTNKILEDAGLKRSIAIVNRDADRTRDTMLVKEYVWIQGGDREKKTFQLADNPQHENLYNGAPPTPSLLFPGRKQ